MSDKTIYQLYLEQRQTRGAAGETTTLVVFSEHGYMMAMREEQGMTHRMHRDPASRSETYCGHQYVRDRDRDAPLITLTNKRPADYFREKRGAGDPVIVTFGKAGLDPELGMFEVLGQNLTAPQLCDIIQAWLNSDDYSHFGKFERGLYDLLKAEGRFE